MYYLISGSLHANALHLGFALICAVLAFTSHKAQSEESMLSALPDLATARYADSVHDLRLTTSVASPREEEAFSRRYWLGNSPRLHVYSETKQQNNGDTETLWKQTHEDEPWILQLRRLSKEDGVVIKPRRHSIMVFWQKSF